MDDNDSGRRRPAEMTDDDERETKRIRLDEAAILTPTTIFDSKGDLHLVVGSDVRAGDPSTFLVCSKALARASPVFDKMLFGPFAESRPSTESSKQDPAWIVHLPEDELSHMEAVLNILHFNYKEIPQYFAPPLLSGMVTIADKYDCIGIFKLWGYSCVPYAECDDRHPPKFALHIAWQLGCIRKFKEAMAVIIDQSFISGDGRISIVPKVRPRWDEDEEASATRSQDLCKYLGDLVPAEIVDQIRDHRAKLINAVMEPFITLHDDLANSRERCPIPSHQQECDKMLLGSLIRSFRKTVIEEATRDAARRYRGTILDLEQSLDSVELLGKSLLGTSHHDDFLMACRLDVEKRLVNGRALRDAEEAEKGDTIVLLPEQEERLRRQATVTVEEDGDLLLVAGCEGLEPTTYLVCSRALARHSPVFKAMLFGDFAEARPTDGSQWVVEVSGDNPYMFPMFLSIVHGCFKDVRTKLDIYELGALLVIVQKYDALPIIRPWVREWMEHARDLSGKHEGEVHKVVYKCPTDGQELLHGFQFTDHEALHPPGLFEYLGKLRDDIVKALMAPYLEIYKTLAQRQSPEHDFTFHACLEPRMEEDEQLMCESTVLGSLIIGFSCRGIDITQKDFEYHLELDDLTKLLHMFPLKTSYRHYDCASRIDHRIQESHREEERLIAEADIIRPEHLEHIQKQAQKTGLDEDNEAGGIEC
ncbi:hypothetical protein CcaCcLH18_13920 [Colletotrichum camelliae]|nr:hypothetical protein CcaCcLH18_13920 [Colletotrichum camelliae]